MRSDIREQHVFRAGQAARLARRWASTQPTMTPISPEDRGRYAASEAKNAVYWARKAGLLAPTTWRVR